MISEVHNIDCMAFMATLPDKFFDIALLDPEYGINADREHREGCGWVQRKQPGWDKKRPTPEYWSEIFRTSKNQIVCGGNYFTDFLPPSMGWVIWDKGQREFSLADCEMIYTSFDVAARVFNYSRGKATDEGNKTGGKFHPTRKPIPLYAYLLKNYANPGDKIFDSHMGSQSSRIAAYDKGFDYWGCELDEDYFADGCKRFDKFKSQVKLFTPDQLREQPKQERLFE